MSDFEPISFDPKNNEGDAILLVASLDWENLTYEELVYWGDTCKILSDRALEEINIRVSAGTHDKAALTAAVRSHLIAKQKQDEEYVRFHKESLIEFFNSRKKK
jgi:hypothetical protein